MLYDHEKSLKATEERIRASNISRSNKQHIFEFESYCFAEGLSTARVLKHLTELKLLADMAGNDFQNMTRQEMMKLVEHIERMKRAERTKQDYKKLIRKFFKWMDKGDLVDWIKISRKGSRKLPEDMLSEEEIEKMINACEHPRDRAMIGCLYESGTRISELGNLKIQHG